MPGLFFLKKQMPGKFLTRKKGVMSEIYVRATKFECRTIELVNEDSTTRRNWSAVVVSSKEFFEIETITEYRFSLKDLCDLIKTHS